MKPIASLALALLCALAFTSSPAQPLRNVGRVQQVAPFKTPPLYTPAQRAAALAKVMNLTTPPPLGAPFSITPARPVVPGTAGLMLGDVQAYSAALESPDGVVMFHKTKSAGATVQFNAQKGKRYALDCRINAPRVFYGYNLGANHIEGETATDPYSHAVFATSAMPSDGQLMVTLWFMTDGFTPQVNILYFWGCEVSPF